LNAEMAKRKLQEKEEKNFAFKLGKREFTSK